MHEPASATPSKIRLPGVDGARFLAAVAVIWIHTAESESGRQWVPLCRVAVPFFVASLVGLNMARLLGEPHPETWAAYTKKRFIRLYVPFLLWSLIYLALRVFKHHYQPDGSPIFLGPSSLVNGTAHHLWFLPLAFLLSLLLLPASVLLRRSSKKAAVTGSLLFLFIAITTGLTTCPIHVDPINHPVTYFAGMSWATLPAAFLALSLAPWLPAQPGFGVIVAAWVGVLIVGFLLSFTRGHPLLPGLGGAALWVGAHARMPFPLSNLFAKAGALSFSIYLIHVAFVEGIQAACGRFTLDHSLCVDLMIGAGALVGSVISILLARRIEPLNTLFPH